MDVVEMLPLYEDPWFTFRFADDRLIARFHLEGVEAGRQVSVYKMDTGTGNRLGLVFIPFLAGLVAAATGVAGILLLIAASLSASAAGMGLSRRKT